MKHFKFSIILFLLIEISACKNEQKSMQDNISTQEKSLFSANSKTQLNNKQAMDLIAQYTAFAQKFPNENATPEYLFKKAELQTAIQQFQGSIDTYQQLFETYKNFDKRPQALFLQAFVYENYLKNNAKAREIYQQFLTSFPNDDFADDAKASIEYIDQGLSAEDLVKKFQENLEKQKKK